MATELFTDSQGRTQSRDTETGAEAGAAAATAAASTAAGLGAREKNHGTAPGKSPQPKMSDFGGDLGQYGEAMRKWRNEQDADPENQGQKRALKAMQK
jgi:hypothetical protein